MLSLFPELYSWSFFAPMLLRIVLGLFVLSAAWHAYQKAKAARTHFRGALREEVISCVILSGVLLADSVLLVIGLYLQLAAVIACASGVVALWLKKGQSSEVPESTWAYILMTIIALSLVVLGPGAYAVDLPL